MQALRRFTSAARRRQTRHKARGQAAHAGRGDGHRDARKRLDAVSGRLATFPPVWCIVPRAARNTSATISTTKKQTPGGDSAALASVHYPPFEPA